MKRSRSGQAGSAGSNFRKRVNSTVATSAAPIGRPGWPDFACSTASMARARIAFAMRSCWVRGIADIVPWSGKSADGSTTAREDFGGVMGTCLTRDSEGLPLKMRELLNMCALRVNANGRPEAGCARGLWINQRHGSETAREQEKRWRRRSRESIWCTWLRCSARQWSRFRCLSAPGSAPCWATWLPAW